MADKTKNFIGEFKEFISRGNVMDMAVGIIIGTAFTAIVNSLVKEIIMPFIGWLIGGINFSDFKFPLPLTWGQTTEVFILYGSFLQQIINFLIISFIVFIMVKLLNRFRRKKEEAPKAPPAPPADIALLTEIRDLLKKDAK
ncbi:large-conductance mechanosensitive channel protein MscL [Oscillospiraceae bacterium PP1C4]